MPDTTPTGTHLTVKDPRSMRQQEMKEWSERQAREVAMRERLDMTDDHWEVVNRLRSHYVDNGHAVCGRELGDMLTDSFSDRGGSRYLYRLFPSGPVSQGMRVAGLELPPHTSDGGFGTSR